MNRTYAGHEPLKGGTQNPLALPAGARSGSMRTVCTALPSSIAQRQ
ncbi:Uncharacterised protein [Comamonas testosteroni]|uniref:Uncharacterized protein n=1 Tax=Comamonas testosteroni TaxID=285 RepID=A0A8B4S661_COMTE|nr:hypothetical protein DFO48_105422 [Comamonas sp. AG1104]SUY78396.1 Uncharacterised protein [Comamonas testosteroni]